jgi:hypothetical protein
MQARKRGIRDEKDRSVRGPALRKGNKDTSRGRERSQFENRRPLPRR